MNDLISREETISYIENWKEVNKYYHPYTKNTNIPIDEVIQVIKDVPSNNQTSVISELEKIKAELENPKAISMDFFDGLAYAEEIIDKRISELKGENK